MKRGESRLYPDAPLPFGVRRSSDGKWVWSKEDDKILPWFAFKKKDTGFSLKLGEYMFFVFWPSSFKTE